MSSQIAAKSISRMFANPSMARFSWNTRILSQEFEFRAPTDADIPILVDLTNKIVADNPMAKALGITHHSQLSKLIEFMVEYALAQPPELHLSCVAFDKESERLASGRLGSIVFRYEEDEPVKLVPPPLNVHEKGIMELIKRCQDRVWEKYPIEEAVHSLDVSIVTPKFRSKEGMLPVILAYGVDSEKLQMEMGIRYGVAVTDNDQRAQYIDQGFTVLDTVDYATNGKVPLLAPVNLMLTNYSTTPVPNVAPYWEAFRQHGLM